jgi:hypothetical protein
MIRNNGFTIDPGDLIRSAMVNPLYKLLIEELEKYYPSISTGFKLKLQEKLFVYYQHLLKLPVDNRVAIYLHDNPGIATRINNIFIAQCLGMCRTRFSKAYADYRKRRHNGFMPS